jgi:hypothetical protein
MGHSCLLIFIRLRSFRLVQPLWILSRAYPSYGAIGILPASRSAGEYPHLRRTAPAGYPAAQLCYVLQCGRHLNLRGGTAIYHGPPRCLAPSCGYFEAVRRDPLIRAVGANGIGGNPAQRVREWTCPREPAQRNQDPL